VDARAPNEQLVVPIEGRFDAVRAPALDDHLQALLRAGHLEITLDLARVRYLGSSGLRMLLLAHRRQLAAGGHLTLRRVPPRILRTLQMAGFDQILTIELSPPTDETNAGGPWDG